jgi:hypothetical protein
MPRKSLPSSLKNLSVLGVKLTQTTEEELWTQFVDGYEQVLTAYKNYDEHANDILDEFVHGNPYTTSEYWSAFRTLYNRRKQTWIPFSQMDFVCPRPCRDGKYISGTMSEKQAEDYMHAMSLAADYRKVGAILKWSGRDEYDVFAEKHEKLRVGNISKDLAYFENLRFDEALNQWKNTEEGRHFARGMTCSETCSYCEKDKQIEFQKNQFAEERRREKEEQDRKEQDEYDRQHEEEEEDAEEEVEVPVSNSLPSGPQMCEACNYKTIHPYFFKKHMESKEHERNARQKSMFCTECNHQSRTEIEHASHVTSKKHKVAIGDLEKDPDVFECEVCGYSTKTKHCYITHMKSKKHLIAVGELEKDPEVFHCETCQYSTPTKQCYLVHMNSKKHKMAAGELEPEGQKVYTCELCQYSSHRKQNLAIHLISEKHKRKVQEQK